MAQEIKVQLQINDREFFDLNKIGLQRMQFDRLLSNESNIESGVLSNLSIDLFDKTGQDALSIISAAGNKVYLRYGFGDDLSRVYGLQIVQLNTTYSNLGAIVSFTAVASSVTKRYGPELFTSGTKVKDILLAFANRNGWDHDIQTDAYLRTNLYKTSNQTDYEFIESKLKQIANGEYVDLSGKTTIFYEVKLVEENGKIKLYFRPKNKRTITRRVWDYDYGVSTNSLVLNVTNKIDMSFLLNGLSLRIPISLLNNSITSDTIQQADVENILMTNIDYIQSLFTKYNLPKVDVKHLIWKIETVPTSDLEDLTMNQIILNKLEEVVSAINTIEMTVVGNNKINQGDLINLTVKNQQGQNTIISSTGKSLWRVISISEEIGQNGYSTKLGLVRETI